VNLQRALEHLKSFKQIAVDQTGEKKRLFHVGACINEVLLSLSPKLKNTRHQIALECPESLIIESYPGICSQIMTNLVMNALIHAFDETEEGEIRIEVRREGPWLSLRFADNGKGIPEEDRGRIFEPFFTTKRGEGGSGLGLAIVSSLVTQQLNGRIECESSPGEGTCFLIQIPYGAQTPGSETS
jgi:signal transduction histidine kinase